jgi:hypothetical protein
MGKATAFRTGVRGRAAIRHRAGFRRDPWGFRQCENIKGAVRPPALLLAWQISKSRGGPRDSNNLRPPLPAPPELR